MAIKIRCADCRKRISVDQGFAGGMCRCPYCKSIVLVPETAAKRGGTGLSGLAGSGLLGRTHAEQPARPMSPNARPGSPVESSGLKNMAGKARPRVSTSSPKRPARPAQTRIPAVASPKISAHHVRKGPSGEVIYETTKVDLSQLSAEQLAAIPMGEPIKLQGIAVIVMLAAMVLMLVASVILLVQMYSEPDGPNGGTPLPPAYQPEATYCETNPYVDSGELVVAANVAIQAPVVYCIDGGGGMVEYYDLSVAMIRLSIRSILHGKFAMVLAREEKPELIVPMRGGGKSAERTVRTKITSVYEDGKVALGGRSDMTAAVRKALSLRPKTLVLIPGTKEFLDASVIGKEIQKSGCALILISYDGSKAVTETWKALLKAAGAKARHILYEPETIIAFYGKAKLPK